ncbi:MAG: carboxypeptidase regulatory-like domain-containing protein, partial [Stenotrophomonas sp.]|nr:carboxypeptidase regulatory-like domain-containing protein [Stenotrophomonas sp.]
MSSIKRAASLKRTSIVVALMSIIGAASAQSTTGSLYGSAPGAAGASIMVESDSGLKRTVEVNANGRYTLGSLPVGKYTVTLQ